MSGASASSALSSVVLPAPLRPTMTIFSPRLTTALKFLMTVVSAVSGLNVALPDLARETGATQTQITWIVDAYTVVFAGLLLFAGAIGDRFGRRLLLVTGLAVFGAAAAAGSGAGGVSGGLAAACWACCCC